MSETVTARAKQTQLWDYPKKVYFTNKLEIKLYIIILYTCSVYIYILMYH